MLLLPIFLIGQDAFLKDGNDYIKDGDDFLKVRLTGIYYTGKSSTGTPPNESAILAGTKSTKLMDTIFLWNPNTLITEYGWFATTEKFIFKYRQNTIVLWDIDEITIDIIGEGENLISLSPLTVNVAGELTYIYMFNYPTDINDIIKLKTEK